MGKRFESYARLAAIAFLLVGCFYVLRPFLAAILFALAVTISSWPLFLSLVTRSKDRRTLAAAVMTVALVLVIIVPLALVTYNMADDVSRVYEQIKVAFDAGAIAPASKATLICS